MSKSKARDLDNVTRLITMLPGAEVEKVLKDIKKEKDPEEKRRIIEHTMKKKGLEPL